MSDSTEQEFSAPEGVENPAPDATALKAEIEKLKHENLLQRADFENLRRRMEKQKQDDMKYAALPMVKELVVVIDTLELALNHAPTEDPMRQGVAMVLDGLLKTLARFGVERVEAKGQPFDPSKHEAMGVMCDPAQPDNVVLEAPRPGYTMHERLVRPAGIFINRLPHQPEEQAPGHQPLE